MFSNGQKCVLCRMLWCHSEVDLWPIGYEMSSPHAFLYPTGYLCEILSELAHEFLTYGHSDFDLWPPQIYLVHPWVKADMFAEFKAIPSHHSRDIVFTRRGRTDLGSQLPWILTFDQQNLFSSSMSPGELFCIKREIEEIPCRIPVISLNFLRYHIQKNGTDLRTQWPWTLTFENQNLISSSLSLRGHLYQELPSKWS